MVTLIVAAFQLLFIVAALSLLVRSSLFALPARGSSWLSVVVIVVKVVVVVVEVVARLGLHVALCLALRA